MGDLDMRKRLNPEERRERRRRAMQRSKFALPSTLTLLSVFCGFSSVVMSINAIGANPSWYFLWAGSLLIAAAVLDGLDGRVARATNTTSEFGVQLDSLADVLSFGMAPAILAYRYGFFQVDSADPHLRYVGWAAGFFFVACGALRLARFNVQVGFADSRFFVGMPIPVGAACIAAVILCWPAGPQSVLLTYLFAFELFAVAILMVSTLGFPSFKKPPKSPAGRLWRTVTIVGMLSLLLIFQAEFILIFFATYTVATLLLNIAWRMGWKGILPPMTHATPIMAEPADRLG